MLNLSNPSHARKRNVHSRLIRIIYVAYVKFVYQMKNAQYKEPVKDAAISREIVDLRSKRPLTGPTNLLLHFHHSAFLRQKNVYVHDKK